MRSFIDQRFIDPLDESSRWRAPFRWLTRWGMDLIAYFADVGGGGGSANDCPNECDATFDPKIRCCNLACPLTPCPYEGDPSNFTCPEPYQKTAWTCCEGSTMVGCGECACGGDCFQSPWYCSIAFEAGTC